MTQDNDALAAAAGMMPQIEGSIEDTAARALRYELMCDELADALKAARDEIQMMYLPGTNENRQFKLKAIRITSAAISKFEALKEES